MPEETRRNQNLARGRAFSPHSNGLTEHEAYFPGLLEDELYLPEVNLEKVIFFLQLMAIFLKCFGNIRRENKTENLQKVHTELKFTKISHMGLQNCYQSKTIHRIFL